MPGLRDDDPLYSMISLRQKYAQDQGMQNLLGPLEHKQFMEEVTKRDPFLGSLLMVSAPFYTGMKMMGVNPSDDKSTLTSAGSVDEIFSAFDGYMKGLGI